MARPRLELVQSALPRERRQGAPGLASEVADPPAAEASVGAPQPRRSERSSQREALAALTDAELVLLASQELAGAHRNHGACEQLYRRHAAFAFNLAARIAGSTRDVEDVVHDSFLRAFDHLPSLRSPGAFRVWLGSIVVHGMRSRLRRGRFLRFFGVGSRNDLVDLESIIGSEAPPSARAELAQVYELLGTLPADDRIAWTLRFVEGHDLVETAELCGCSLATVKRRLSRAQRFVDSHFVGHGDGLAIEEEP